MKKRQLFSLIITALILCTLLPTLAFAATIDDNPEGTTLAEFASGDTMATNNGTITNNYGTVTTNTGTGTVTNNFGTVTNNFGTVINNFGTASVGGGTLQHQLWQVNVSGGANTTFSGVTATDDGKLWVKEGTSAVIGPASGYTITAATTSNGTITKGTDGKWTLSGVTDATNVTLTVTANNTPKTGVDRDTGILTALALVSGIVLVTALPKKKTRA